MSESSGKSTVKDLNRDGTVEVNPEQLSEEIVEGLVEEGALDEEFAREYGDQVWFEEVDTPEPTKREGFTERVSDILGGVYSNWNKRSAFVTIESVERTEDDKVQLEFSHTERKDRTVYYPANSERLGNLLALAGVENAKDLEGGRVVITDASRGRFDLFTPRNLSLYGRSRYKAYSAVEQIRTKTRIRSIDEDSSFILGFLTTMSWVVCGGIAVIVENASEVAALVVGSPSILLTTISCLVILYGLFRGILFGLSRILNGDFERY